jgi:hypothetical protein
MFELQQYEVSVSPRSVQCCPICHPLTKGNNSIALDHREHRVAQTAKDCVDLVHPLHSLTDTAALLRRIEEIELRLTTTRSAAQTSPSADRHASVLLQEDAATTHDSFQRELFGRVEECVEEHMNVHEALLISSRIKSSVVSSSPSPTTIQRVSTPLGNHSNELVDESTGTEVRQSVDRGCGDSKAKSLASHHTTLGMESVVLISILKERYSGYQEASSNAFDAFVLQKSDLLCAASSAVVAEAQSAFLALRRVADRSQRDARLSQCLSTISRMEELNLDHTAVVVRWFEESVTKVSVEWTRSTHQRLSIERTNNTTTERTVIHEVIPKSSSNSSIVELDHHPRQLDDPLDSDKDEPIEPRIEVPRQPTPGGIRKNSASKQIESLRVPPMPQRSSLVAQHAANQRTIKKRPAAVLQPPWNGSTSLFDEPVPQARSMSAPRKRSSYAENFALSTASRARLGVEEPTSSFLESATPRYQVRFAGTSQHHRHARCRDHWCEDLDLH